MIIKYVDPNSGCTNIRDFSGVSVEHSQNSEHKYEMTFVCEDSLCVICVFFDSYAMTNEYMNQIYETGKVDFTTEVDCQITVDSFVDTCEMPDYLKDLFDDNFDTDSDYE